MRIEAFELGVHHVRPLAAEDGPALQVLFERDPGHFEAIQGAPPGPAEAQSAFSNLPPGAGYEQKVLLGVFAGADELLGVVDLVADHPEPGRWACGALFLDPAIRRRGVASALADQLRTVLVAARAIEVRARAGHHAGGLAATAFQASVGFVPAPDRRDDAVVLDLGSSRSAT